MTWTPAPDADPAAVATRRAPMSGLPTNGPVREPPKPKVAFKPKTKRSTMEAAAKILQSRFRAKIRARIAAKGVIYQQVYKPSVMEKAALLLQTLYRGKRDRRRCQDLKDEREVDEYNRKKRESKFTFKASHPPSYYNGAAKLLQTKVRASKGEPTSPRESAAERKSTFKQVKKVKRALPRRRPNRRRRTRRTPPRPRDAHDALTAPCVRARCAPRHPHRQRPRRPSPPRAE